MKHTLPRRKQAQKALLCDEVTLQKIFVFRSFKGNNLMFRRREFSESWKLRISLTRSREMCHFKHNVRRHTATGGRPSALFVLKKKNNGEINAERLAGVCFSCTSVKKNTWRQTKEKTNTSAEALI